MAWERLIIRKALRGKISLLVLPLGIRIKATYTSIAPIVSVQHSHDREEPGARHIKRGEEIPPAPSDRIYDKWFFISGAAVYAPKPSSHIVGAGLINWTRVQYFRSLCLSVGEMQNICCLGKVLSPWNQ